LTAYWAAVAGIFGLAVGSFLNVVIYRVPAGLSVVSPPSACPKCGHEIRNRHNVPVFGWLVLRGRCYDCKAPISARYPAVEAVTALLFAAVTARLLHDDRAWLVPAYLYLVALGVVAALIAVDGQRLPSAIVSTSYAAVYGLLVLDAALDNAWWGLGRAAIATVGLAVLGLLAKDRMSPDARELAQIVAAPLAFLSWWLLAYATVLNLVATLTARRLPSATCFAAAALVATCLPVP
jgi:leader peptidase (prepilin peptidase)/N-methyltransferase